MSTARRGASGAAALLIFCAAAGSAAPPVRPAARSYPTGRFEVAGHLVPPHSVLDARALADLAGHPSLMVTLDPGAAAAIGGAAGSMLPVSLDGKAIGTSPADALVTDHVLQVSGAFADYVAAGAIARRISGRDPLPDSESDE